MGKNQLKLHNFDKDGIYYFTDDLSLILPIKNIFTK